jgi:hypothetical protein
MWKAKKTKCGLFAERGRRQRGLCRVLLAIALGNSGKKFPSSGVPSFVERSCTGRSAQNFFRKNKKLSLPTAFAPGARHMIFFQKNRKTIFADGLCQGLSAQNFLKKNKNPLFADGPDSRPSAKTFQKPLS